MEELRGNTRHNDCLERSEEKEHCDEGNTFPTEKCCALTPEQEVSLGQNAAAEAEAG